VAETTRKSAVDVWWMIGFMPAVGDLVRCTDGSWMTRPPQSCPRGHRLLPGAMLPYQGLPASAPGANAGESPSVSIHGSPATHFVPVFSPCQSSGVN
jgi:hypothetical protein